LFYRSAVDLKQAPLSMFAVPDARRMGDSLARTNLEEETMMADVNGCLGDGGSRSNGI
jgi:hypothetical protein